MSKTRNLELLARGRAITEWGANRKLLKTHRRLYHAGYTSTRGAIYRRNIQGLLERLLKPRIYSWRIVNDPSIQEKFDASVALRPRLSDPQILALQLNTRLSGHSTTVSR